MLLQTAVQESNFFVQQNFAYSNHPTASRTSPSGRSYSTILELKLEGHMGYGFWDL